MRRHGKDNDIRDLIQILVSLIEEKDPFLKGHSERVARICVSFGKKLSLPEMEIDNLYLAGLLHDLGMVHLPQGLLRKPVDLTMEEKSLLRQHPVVAERILSKNRHLKEILPIIRQHHEAFDGTGYPDGLKGGAIHLGARILRLADTYDALISTRPQRPGMSPSDAIEEMKRGAGKAFDPDLLKEFISHLKTLSGMTEGGGAAEDEEDLRGMVMDLVEKFREGKIELPHLPRVVQEIQKVAHDPSSGVDDLVKVIERDGVISLKLISLANSSWYRRLEEIYSVRRAIPLLGFRETQGIIMAIAYRDLYEVKGVEYRVVMENLWLHSLASAFAAKAIAEDRKFKDSDRFFLMGLIHDIGKVPLLKALSETAPAESFDLSDVLSHVAEAYPLVSEETLKRWNFSDEFIHMARRQATLQTDSPLDQACLVINLASHMASWIGYGDGIDHGETELQDLEASKLLGFTPETIAKIGKEVEESVRHSAHFI
ncbi:MAG: HDOD domain-containing protein [Deltaproteobacteria bacterium]|nr:HDOD domain-containing protein [Deltaproteobacteria bacterium]MBW2018041.1 HDOD domain-containing protein [Deltaproteobacteria bacterium]